MTTFCRASWRRAVHGVLAPTLLAGALVGGAEADGPSARPAATLRVGASAFWASSAPRDSSIAPKCADNMRCHDFAIDVAGGGDTLRVAVDTNGQVSPQLQVFSAKGILLEQSSGVFSAEVFLDQPDAGRHVARVVFRSSRAVKFRMRARLERSAPEPRASSRALLPNLRLVPPYQFTMDSPAAGQDLGCNAYEKAEYGARRCLRFSLGPANVGEGPFMLRFPALSGLAAPEPVYQLIDHADGSLTERQAGSALYHKTHAHHHHNGFGSLELYRVTDPRRGTLVPAGGGPKQGFCMLDFLIADWRSFANDQAGAVRQDCSLVSGPTSTQLGLGRGWADIYVWSLDGNYVEFGSNPDGRYVVRSVADASNDVLESDETDNSGYAYIEVKGSSVKVLERGRGLSPWDRRKVLADDILPPNV
ncbi:MAG TPA: lysyl oxidase family protein [Mycobacteriales bacterium]|nr:lysyl oxidase family protein [Mycobacteriales bacterium]